MNATGRKTLTKLHAQLEAMQGTLEDLRSEIETIKDEEADKLSNMPEGLQDGDRGQKMQEGVEYLEAAYEAMDSMVTSLEEAMEAIDNATQA